MFNIAFEEYCYLPFFIIILGFQWFFFLKNNFFAVRIKPAKTDKLIHSNVVKKLYYKHYINWNFISLLFLVFLLTTVIGYQQTFWWNHFKITNFNLYLIYILTLVSILVVFLIRYIPSNNLNYNVDYFFIISNLAIILFFIFFCNTLYTFFFILELTSSFIFYKFVVSKFWFKQNKFSFLNLYTKWNKIFPKFYLNMLFFQYWVTFFSSVLLLYAIINFFLLFGTSEWLLLNYLINNNFNINYFTNWFFFFILLFTFLMGFLLKIGFSPLHLFKIEVYKGIPFISIFFYTTYYFLVFFLFFILLVITYLYSFITYWWLLIFFFILSGGLYVISLFFDVNYIKAFFAYSTVINSFSLSCLVLSFL